MPPSTIAEFAARQTAHNDKMATALSALESDIKSLNAKIAEFQGTSGKITDEDQALLDGLELTGQQIQSKLQELDDLTPPDGSTSVPAPAVTDGPVNPNRLPTNTDQTSAQLRGNAAQKASEDPQRAPNPPTDLPAVAVPSRPTVGPVGPRV